MLDFIINAFKIIFLLGFLVFIHEGGHFVVAKLCKIKVNEFALGFGPTILKKQGKETKYALRLIPLGGFVNLEGEEIASDAEGSYSKASNLKKISILIAGGTVNILFGLILYFAVITYNGNFVVEENNIPDYAVEIGQLQNGNKIIRVEGFANNLYYGFLNTVKFSTSIIDNVKQIFQGNISKEQLTGPVGISNMVSKTEGAIEYVYIIAMISISLGVTNLLPFPPLDGGKVLLILIEIIRRKKLSENTEISIQLTGFALMIALSIYVTYNDILRIFK